MSTTKSRDVQVVSVAGAQWGDDGKGKIVDYLAESMDYVVRAAGGANAGHTISVDGETYIFHLVPSGILHGDTVCIIGNGCVVNLLTVKEELESLANAGIDVAGRFFISDRAHLVMPYHVLSDGAQEKARATGKKIGTTGRGIGPTYEDKVNRRGIRAGMFVGDFARFAEKFRENAEYRMRHLDFDMDIDAELAKYKELQGMFGEVIVDTVPMLYQALKDGKRILTEGAQGAHLDVDLGSYPFVTSSCTTVAGACGGSGIPPRAIGHVVGVLKAYTTRVGEGPFPSELTDDTGAYIQEKGAEFGATTGRPRRCGWFDAVVARHGGRMNGVDEWNLTKLDVLSGLTELVCVTDYKHNGEVLDGFPADLDMLAEVELVTETLPGWEEDISGARDFADLPENAQKYVRAIERMTETSVGSIGVGPGREALIFVD